VQGSGGIWRKGGAAGLSSLSILFSHCIAVWVHTGSQSFIGGSTRLLDMRDPIDAHENEYHIPSLPRPHSPHHFGSRVLISALVALPSQTISLTSFPVPAEF